jgi:hypothetical protein
MLPNLGQLGSFNVTILSFGVLTGAQAELVG